MNGLSSPPKRKDNDIKFLAVPLRNEPKIKSKQGEYP